MTNQSPNGETLVQFGTCLLLVQTLYYDVLSTRVGQEVFNYNHYLHVHICTLNYSYNVRLAI